MRQLSEEEILFLKKLNFVKFNERTVQNLSTIFYEDSILFTKLLTDRVLFSYEKEGKKLIGIDKDYRHLLTKEAKELIEELFEKDFVVIKEPAMAKDISYLLRKEGKDSLLNGVKAFDGNFYLITIKKLEECLPLILDQIKPEARMQVISTQTKLPTELCRTVLELLKDQGEIIEKEKDHFKKV